MATQLFFKTPSGATAFVDTGFSWTAFAFGPLWAIAKRQWLMFLLLCIGELPTSALYMIAELRGDAALFILSTLLSLAYMLVCGAYGNRWHRYFLERRGYAFEAFA
jgi:hypothetical protein